MKRKISLALCVILAVLLTACGSRGKDNEAGKEAESAAPAAEDAETGEEIQASEEADGTEIPSPGTGGETGAAAGADGLIALGSEDREPKVGMSSGIGGIKDHSYNQSAWEGLKDLNRDTGLYVCCLESPSKEDFAPNLEQLAGHGCSLCWGVGYEYSEAILEAAEKHPDLNYGIVDHVYEEIPENVTCVSFRSEEAAFLAGYVAAAVSESGKVGFVGGVSGEIIDQFRYGFQAGVDYADSLLNRDTELTSAYTESFTDSDKGRDIAAELYEDGCDVIFHAAGGAGTGVIRAAVEANHYVIGVDCDQSFLAPNHVLTSAVKRVDVAMENVSVQYQMGDNIGGRRLDYGIAEHAVGLPEDHSLYSDEIYEAAMELENEIAGGRIEVPFDETSYIDFTEWMQETGRQTAG